MKSVWLFKTEDSSSLYEKVINDNNYTVENVPTLEFQYLNKHALSEALQKPNEYSGMILTSPRAVQSLGDAYVSIPVSLHKEWDTKKIFVVGNATKEAVKDILRLGSLGSEAGNSKQLAQIIIKETKPFDKPLLFPCGNLKRDDLPTLLAQNDRDFRAVTCYETKRHPQLERTLSKVTSIQKPSFIVFFSPSGVQFTIPLLNKLKVNLIDIKFIAIGPTTNTALVQHDILVSGICPEPSPQGLIEILNGI